MRRFIVSVALAAVLAGSTQAEAQPHIGLGCARPVTAKQAVDLTVAVWNPGRWRRGAPKPTAIAAHRRQVRCAAGPGHRRAIQLRWRARRRRYGRYRAFRLVAPYRGGGTWWAIPYPIVYCESGGSWSAYNPSGAVGPYQLLGWGAPYPARTWREKMANHRIAGKLFRDYGDSPWAASSACWG